jgi:hypothetical protein
MISLVYTIFVIDIGEVPTLQFLWKTPAGRVAVHF